MLNKLFLGGVLVLVVSVIAGESYRHEVVVGARTVQQTEIAPRTRPPVARSTPPPARTSEVSALERRYMLQAVQDARQAAERAERRMQQQLRAARAERASLLREQTRLVRQQQQALLRRPRVSPVRTTPTNYRANTRLYPPLPTSLSPVTRLRERRHLAHDRTHHSPVVLEQTIHIHPCPAGQRLISATCLPANSVIVGQLPIQVEIVNQPRSLSIRDLLRSPRRSASSTTSSSWISGAVEMECHYSGGRFMQGKCVK